MALNLLGLRCFGAALPSQSPACWLLQCSPVSMTARCFLRLSFDPCQMLATRALPRPFLCPAHPLALSPLFNCLIALLVSVS